MSETNKRSGFAVGLNKGRLTKLPAKMEWKTKPVTRKGNLAKRNTAVRAVIREVAGYSPLEKRMIELIRSDNAVKEKKAVKIARKRIGTHRRACFTKQRLVDAINAGKKK